MADYDIFAPFYDLLMGDRSDVVEIIQKQVIKYTPQATSMLELGCGTGSILSSFGNMHQLAGIDLSSNMLQIAQQKLPQSIFKQGTIAGFELGQSFDVIVCVFDTLNHLMLLSDWQKTFISAKKHLKDRGIFIFDIDTISRLQALAASSGYTQELPNDSIAELMIEKTGNAKVRWHIRIQETQSNDVIQVYEDYVYETSFPLKSVEHEIRKNFEILSTFDSAGAIPSEQSERIYFVCR